jgi:hypothetical protein
MGLETHPSRLGLLRGLRRGHCSNPDHHTKRDLVNKIRKVVDQVQSSFSAFSGTEYVADWVNCPTYGHNQAQCVERVLARWRTARCADLACFTCEDLVDNVKPASHSDSERRPIAHRAKLAQETEDQHHDGRDH